MGCDGGTIPKRKEIVKSKKKDNEESKNAEIESKWQFCAISGLPLRKPVVSCQLGRLYNKDAILEYLLDCCTSPVNVVKPGFSHIRSMKDVKELKLKDHTKSDTAKAPTSSRDPPKAQFVCPISGLELNGIYKFMYILNCGCVISEKAIKEVSDDNHCIVCSKSYDPRMDRIILNGNEAEQKLLRERLLERKKLARSSKVSKTKDVKTNTKRESHSRDINDLSSSAKRQKSN